MSMGEEIFDQGRRGRPRDPGKEGVILDAASTLFLERGFDGASLDAVAHMAGVSKTTIYARFGDKEALFRATLRRKCETMVPTDSFDPDPARPMRETLILIATRIVDLVTSDDAIGLHRMIVAQSAHSARMAELFFDTAVMPLTQRLNDWMTAQAECGRLRLDDPEGMAWRFLGAVKGEAHLRAAIGLPAPPRARLERHIAACVDDFLAAHAIG